MELHAARLPALFLQGRTYEGGVADKGGGGGGGGNDLFSTINADCLIISCYYRRAEVGGGGGGGFKPPKPRYCPACRDVIAAHAHVDPLSPIVHPWVHYAITTVSIQLFGNSLSGDHSFRVSILTRVCINARGRSFCNEVSEGTGTTDKTLAV